MARAIGEVVVGEYFSQSQMCLHQAQNVLASSTILSLISASSMEASSKKDYLVKVHNIAPVWKSKEELLQQITSTLAKVWNKTPLPLQEVGGTYDGLETFALVTTRS